MKIQEVCITYNGDLDFSNFNSHDIQMIKEDKNVVFAQADEQRINISSSGIFNQFDMMIGPQPQRDP